MSATSDLRRGIAKGVVKVRNVTSMLLDVVLTSTVTVSLPQFVDIDLAGYASPTELLAARDLFAKAEQGFIFVYRPDVAEPNQAGAPASPPSLAIVASQAADALALAQSLEQKVDVQAPDNTSRVVYISPIGSDAHDGSTAPLAVLTFDRVAQLIPTAWRGSLTVVMDTANGPHVLDNQVIFGGDAVGSTAPPLLIQGGYAVIVAERAATGVGANTLTDGTRSWTPHAFRGMRLVVKSGAGAGWEYTIVDNSATQLTIAYGFSVMPANTDHYEVSDAAAQLHYASAFGTSGRHVRFIGVKLQGTGGFPVATFLANRTSFQGCKIDLGGGQLYIGADAMVAGEGAATDLTAVMGACVKNGFASAGIVAQQFGSPQLLGIWVIDGADMDMQGAIIDLASPFIYNSVLSLEDSRFYAIGGNVPGAISQGRIAMLKASIGTISGLDISNATGSGLLLSGGSNCSIDSLTGAANSRYGIEVLSGSRVDVGGGVTVTGTLGDAAQGAAVQSYASLAALGSVLHANEGIAVHETLAKPIASGTSAGTLDENVATASLATQPGHPRTLDVAFAASYAGGAITITGTGPDGSVVVETFAATPGATVAGAKVFVSVNASGVVNGTPGGGGGHLATVKTGAILGVARRGVTFLKLSVDGVAEALAASSSANGSFTPTSTPNAAKIFEVWYRV